MSAPTLINEAFPPCGSIWCNYCQLEGAILNPHDIADQCQLYENALAGRPYPSHHHPNNLTPEWQRHYGVETFLPDLGQSASSPSELLQSRECLIQEIPQHHPYFMQVARGQASSTTLDRRTDSEVITTYSPAPASASSTLSSESGQRLGSQLYSRPAAHAPTSSQYDPTPYPASPTYHFHQSLPWSNSQSAAYTPSDVSPTQSIQSTLLSSSVPSLSQSTLSQYDYTSYHPQSLQWSDPQSAAYTTNDASPSPPTMSPSSLTRSRRFKCDTCDKKFTNKQNLESMH
ncbi:hypothetical protein BT96DRAFT_987239 [Gymnopus androsaceus JB14]|uniref:Uncharacterized protein n=1 Tax=Gymnopus androsaceus JB14 TaxID=1447944 RepID=A0A6A4I9K8_9AGAR|nr:hypothetical protein BT96DRAFT_987239 [Gymnopus androsaceus JB14]